MRIDARAQLLCADRQGSPPHLPRRNPLPDPTGHPISAALPQQSRSLLSARRLYSGRQLYRRLSHAQGLQLTLNVLDGDASGALLAVPSARTLRGWVSSRGNLLPPLQVVAAAATTAITCAIAGAGRIRRNMGIQVVHDLLPVQLPDGSG